MEREVCTVAVMAPGEMGHAIGGVLRQNGLRVITCPRGRSARTVALAQQADIAISLMPMANR